MRDLLKAVSGVAVAVALIVVADWAASLANRSPRHEAGAPLVSHMRRAATTTTTSTSSTTSTSTTTTTTTSTSTSTTTSTVPGDVSQDANWVTIIYAEEATPASTDLADSSANSNPLSSGTCSTATTNTSQFIQGSAAVNTGTASVCRFNCNVGDGCTDADFHFTGASDDFTVFMFVRPTEEPTAASCLMGTDDTFGTGGGSGGWALYADASSRFAFRTDNDTTEVVINDPSAFSANTWYSLAATYDGVDDDAWLEVDGTEVATSTSMVQPNQGATPNFALGDFNSACGGANLQGAYDQVAVYAGRITQAWRTRIQVCLIDGSACSCNTSDPTQYVSRPRHTSQGGPIAGPMPDCNELTIGTE